ncbi:16417_t:CDS:10 [Entrophospora sp. SA101]|nr:16417_t:CDS:10 [Entrophospora sp. SA101]
MSLKASPIRRSSNGLSSSHRSRIMMNSFTYVAPPSSTPTNTTTTTNGEPLKIGRSINKSTTPSETNGFFDSKVLSRSHAEIWFEKFCVCGNGCGGNCDGNGIINGVGGEVGGKVYIKDLKSSNGTFVNGKKIEADNGECEIVELNNKDLLKRNSMPKSLSKSISNDLSIFDIVERELNFARQDSHNLTHLNNMLNDVNHKLEDYSANKINISSSNNIINKFNSSAVILSQQDQQNQYKIIQKSYQDLHELFTKTIQGHEEEKRLIILSYTKQMDEILKEHNVLKENCNDLMEIINSNEREYENNHYAKKIMIKTNESEKYNTATKKQLQEEQKNEKEFVDLSNKLDLTTRDYNQMKENFDITIKRILIDKLEKIIKSKKDETKILEKEKSADGVNISNLGIGITDIADIGIVGGNNIKHFKQKSEPIKDSEWTNDEFSDHDNNVVDDDHKKSNNSEDLESSEDYCAEEAEVGGDNDDDSEEFDNDGILSSGKKNCKIQKVVDMENSDVNLIRLWHSTSEFITGELSRYHISFDSSIHQPSTAWPPKFLSVKVANIKPIVYRSFSLFAPHNLSVSCLETSKLKKNRGVGFKPALKLGGVWRFQLELIDDNDGDGRRRTKGDWTLDIISEIIRSPNSIKYEISIFAEIPENATIEDEFKIFEANYNKTIKKGKSVTTTLSPSIKYELFTTKDIFSLPNLKEEKRVRQQQNDIHLIVLTHGIHGSMLDQLYLKESIEELYPKDNHNRVIVYSSDVLHIYTEDGIEECGEKLAKKILEYIDITNDNSDDGGNSDGRSRTFSPTISKISFIGHSLGGLINVFVVGYLYTVTCGKFFDNIKPIHFITIASPWLGFCCCRTRFSSLRLGMKFGALGQTGKDLALVPRSREQQNKASGAVEENTEGGEDEPLLLALAKPTSESHIALAKFQSRTIYSNIANDVPHVRISLSPPDVSSDHIDRSIKNSYSSILHDKIYTPDEISSQFLSSSNDNDNNSIEVKIARCWHSDLSWRKVILYIEGDAHTNVVVRRKWLNVAGWKVIQHLLDQHKF